MNEAPRHRTLSAVRARIVGCLTSILIGVLLAALALLLYEWAVNAASRPR